MTLYDFGTNTAQKGLNMAAILKFKMAAEDAFEKNGTNSGFVCKGIRMQKNLGSTSIGNFALDYITPCTSSIYPKVNYFSKIEDHIILENGKFYFFTF